jgi:hypothetical protein
MTGYGQLCNWLQHHTMYRLVLVALLMFGCVAEDDNEPSADDRAAADAWAQTSDGKADLPTSYGAYGGLVAWPKNFYFNQLSAVWGKQEQPASSAAAIARIKQLLAAGGIRDPSRTLFKTSDVGDRRARTGMLALLTVMTMTKFSTLVVVAAAGCAAQVDGTHQGQVLASLEGTMQTAQSGSPITVDVSVV